MRRMTMLFVAAMAAVLAAGWAASGEKVGGSGGSPSPTPAASAGQTPGQSVPPEGWLILAATGQKPARFNHTEHVKRAGGSCMICHHTNTEGTGSRCLSCHTIPAQSGIPNAREAFHACIKCHAPGKGPIYPKDCNTCHVRPGM